MAFIHIWYHPWRSCNPKRCYAQLPRATPWVIWYIWLVGTCRYMGFVFQGGSKVALPVVTPQKSLHITGDSLIWICWIQCLSHPSSTLKVPSQNREHEFRGLKEGRRKKSWKKEIRNFMERLRSINMSIKWAHSQYMNLYYSAT